MTFSPVFFPIASLIAGALVVRAGPTNTSALELREPGHVYCGTTSDASLGDCNIMFDQWDGLFETASQCSFLNSAWGSVIRPAWNVACSGNCCVYVAGYGSGGEIDKNKIKGQAQGLMGCADKSSGRINAMQQFDDFTGVCISDRNGCSDCFDDSDFHPIGVSR
ncbi:hypothetical protein C8J57DRAFT_1325237 [Mycena rebaudengoi]|nr:hypothetical protein C8J57DRAFT_1325237 [Mycena rebaudengoi]